jgi:hypothetical protein
MKRIFKSEAFIVLSMSFIALAIDALLWLHHINAAPQGHVFIPIFHSLPEYSRSIEWISYIFGLPYAQIVYHMSRYVLGGLWCMTIYWLVETIVREKWARIWTFAVALFTTQVALAPDMLVGYIMSIAAVTSVIHYVDKPAGKWIFRCLVSACIAIWIHPQGIFPVIAGLCIVVFWKRLGKVAGGIVLGIYILLMLFGKITQSYAVSEYAYPDRDLVKAIQTASVVSRGTDIILAYSSFEIIPLLTGRTAYTGSDAAELFSGEMNVCDAYIFLTKRNIGVVLSGRPIVSYPFLQPWNVYGETTVYMVVDSPPIGCLL